MFIYTTKIILFVYLKFYLVPVNLILSLLKIFEKFWPMLQVYQSFAGCNPNNKSLTVLNNKLYYLSSSNIIVSDDKAIVNTIHFKQKLNCISSLNTIVAVGDIEGNAYIITDESTLSYFLSSKIQDCLIISSEEAVFCTLNTIYHINFQNNIKTEIPVAFIISSIAFIDSYLIVGTITGILYIYTISSGSLILKETIEAHSDLIKCIKKSESNLFATCSQDYNIKIWKLENQAFSLIQTLNGHSDWVNSLFWNESTLFSASSDKTIRIWEKNPNQSSSDAESNFYICTDILGAASEVLNVSILNETLLAQLKTGGIDKIQRNEYFISGHLNEINDLDWNLNMLITCSLDKTSRIFLDGKEFARPQTHGFSLTSIKFLRTENLRFISSGQETILRVYEATQDFIEKCRDVEDPETNQMILTLLQNKDSYCMSAYLSELNLTNEISEEPVDEELSENYLSTHVFREFKKIYGHFFEIKDIAVCSSLILSCNRSATKKFAGLFVWTINGEKMQYLEEHELGIQKIAISPNEKHALTVGRDKLVCLYSIENQKLSCISKFYEHKRIVFDCGFSRDSKYFATCSRDGNIILYDINQCKNIKHFEFNFEVTSLSFSPVDDELVIGNDLGEIFCLNYDLKVLYSLQAVGKKVNILRFNSSGNKIAVGGSDNLLRIIKRS